MTQVKTAEPGVVRTFQNPLRWVSRGMVDEYGTGERQSESTRHRTPLDDWRANLFDELAQRAEDLARTIEFSAEVHAQMPIHLLIPPDHDERGRRLAAAERAAAAAYRAHRSPPDEVRAAIRRAGDLSAR